MYNKNAWVPHLADSDNVIYPPRGHPSRAENVDAFLGMSTRHTCLVQCQSGREIATVVEEDKENRRGADICINTNICT